MITREFSQYLDDATRDACHGDGAWETIAQARKHDTIHHYVPVLSARTS
jgi:hypothetical protein